MTQIWYATSEKIFFCCIPLLRGKKKKQKPSRQSKRRKTNEIRFAIQQRNATVWWSDIHSSTSREKRRTIELILFWVRTRIVRVNRWNDDRPRRIFQYLAQNGPTELTKIATIGWSSVLHCRNMFGEWVMAFYPSNCHLYGCLWSGGGGGHGCRNWFQ